MDELHYVWDWKLFFKNGHLDVENHWQKNMVWMWMKLDNQGHFRACSKVINKDRFNNFQVAYWPAWDIRKCSITIRNILEALQFIFDRYQGIIQLNSQNSFQKKIWIANARKGFIKQGKCFTPITIFSLKLDTCHGKKGKLVEKNHSKLIMGVDFRYKRIM